MDRTAVAALAGTRGAGTRRATAAGARFRNCRGRAVVPERSGCVSVRYIHERTLLAAYQTTVCAGMSRFGAALCQFDNTDASFLHQRIPMTGQRRVDRSHPRTVRLLTVARSRFRVWRITISKPTKILISRSDWHRYCTECARRLKTGPRCPYDVARHKVLNRDGWWLFAFMS
jgi:hypothetical protein